MGKGREKGEGRIWGYDWFGWLVGWLNGWFGEWMDRKGVYRRWCRGVGR